MPTITQSSLPNTITYKGIYIEVLIGGYRWGNIVVKKEQDIFDLIDAVILAHEQHKRKTDY